MKNTDDTRLATVSINFSGKWDEPTIHNRDDIIINSLLTDNMDSIFCKTNKTSADASRTNLLIRDMSISNLFFKA